MGVRGGVASLTGSGGAYGGGGGSESSSSERSDGGWILDRDPEARPFESSGAGGFGEALDSTGMEGRLTSVGGCGIDGC